MRTAGPSRRSTAARLAFQLYDEGVIDLSDTIRDHLPDYGGPGGDRITIENLLVHSGGVQMLTLVDLQFFT